MMPCCSDEWAYEPETECLQRNHFTTYTSVHDKLTHSTRNSFFGSIRTQTSLPTSIRETAMCRVAVLNKAWYELEAHSPILESAPDVSKEQVTAILKSKPRQPLLDVLGEKLSAVLAYTDAMTLDVRVPDVVFERLQKTGFREREIVEITATVAAYNCVSRFLVALDVGERNVQTGPKDRGKE